ncbi:MAG: class I SAM-dependent methyltransferase [Desulforhopalus sp.]
MKFAEIRQLIDKIPYVMDEMASDLYRFIVEAKPAACLELGFGHGASSCYIAAALEEVGSGHLTTVDLVSAQEWQDPAIEQLLERTGLAPWVTVHREKGGYNWFLKKKIQERTKNNICTPLYDFCFLDGAKNWTIDTTAFFLADKLLKRGGWMVFDDLQWTYESKVREGKRKSDGVYMTDMGEDELQQPHIELIFQLLVMQHPDYSNFYIKDNWWAWAQKMPDGKKEPVFRMSEGYIARLAKWEEENGRRHRAPFEPFAE